MFAIYAVSFDGLPSCILFDTVAVEIWYDSGDSMNDRVEYTQNINITRSLVVGIGVLDRAVWIVVGVVLSLLLLLL